MHSSLSFLLPVVDTALTLWALYLVVPFLLHKRNLAPLPPGPKGWPLIGNVSDFPDTHEGRFFAKHRALYGEGNFSLMSGNSV